MPKIAESLVWLDQIEGLRANPQENPLAYRSVLKKSHNLSNTHITALLKINACLDPAAIDKIRQAAKGNPSHILSFRNAQVLASLKSKVTDLPASFHAALDLVLSRRLAPRYIKALVDWIASGKPASAFESKTKQVKPDRQLLEVSSEELGVEKTATAKGEKIPAEGLDRDKLVELSKKAGVEEALGDDAQTTHRDKLKAYLESLEPDGTSEELESEGLGVKKTAKTKTSRSDSEKMGALENAVWDVLAGVPFIAKIKSKVKKGEKLSVGEGLLVFAFQLGKGIHSLSKEGFGLLKKLFKEIGGMIKKVFKTLHKTWLGQLFNYACLFYALWFVWTACFNGISYPLRVTGDFVVYTASRFLKLKDSSSEPITQISPQSSQSESLGKNTETANPNPAPRLQDTIPSKSVGEPKTVSVETVNPNTQILRPWSSTDEDQNYLQAELAALPPFCVIKPFSFTPDASMGAEMANHRLADLTNNEIYSMKIGHNTQKVLSVVPSSTDLTITYQGGLVGGFLDGSSKMEIYWEDVKAIHGNEINMGTTVTYQLSLVVSGSKQPLIIQCASARDLGHLASVLNYFIKTAGSAPYADSYNSGESAQPNHVARLEASQQVPLASLPYLNQGLQLNNDGEVTALWADSPADKAGLRLKDYLWSLETNWPSQENKTQLETGLQAFTPPQGSGGQAVTHQLYVVASAAWDKAVNKNKNTAYGFNPPRTAYRLSINHY